MDGSVRTDGMKRPLARGWRIVIPVLVAIAVSMTAIYLLVMAFGSAMTETYRCTYTLVVDPSGQDEYTVFVPIPCTYLDEIPAFELEGKALVKGDVDVEIMNTLHGPALRIQGTGRAEVNWSSDTYDKESRRGYYPNMTMLEEAQGDPVYDWMGWMSSDSEDVALYLNYSASHRWYPRPFFASGSDHDYSFLMESGEIGWRPVICDYTWAVIN